MTNEESVISSLALTSYNSKITIIKIAKNENKRGGIKKSHQGFSILELPIKKEKKA